MIILMSMTLMATTVAAAVMVVLLLGWGISNSMSDDKSHMTQSVASNTDVVLFIFKASNHVEDDEEDNEEEGESSLSWQLS